MELYLIIITEYNDGKDTRRNITPYDSADAAVAQFHNEMSKAMKDTSVKKTSMFLMDTDGIYRQEIWRRPEEEAEA